MSRILAVLALLTLVSPAIMAAETKKDLCTTIESEELIPWLDKRVDQARHKIRERVRIPIVFRGPYACVCPLNFVGISPWFGAAEGNWIKPVFKGGKKPRYKQSEGLVVVATGQFTGREITKDLRGDQKEMKVALQRLVLSRKRYSTVSILAATI